MILLEKTENKMSVTNSEPRWNLLIGHELWGTFQILLDEEFTITDYEIADHIIIGRFFQDSSKKISKKTLKEMLIPSLYHDISKKIISSVKLGEKTICLQFEEDTEDGKLNIYCSGYFINKDRGNYRFFGFLWKKTSERLDNIDDKARQDQIEQLKQFAYKDSLTNALNRTAIEQKISTAISQMTSQDKFGLFMIDLDNFKQVNDMMGHQQGDKILIRAVSAINSIFRASDFVGRLGGDEFMVFMLGQVNLNTIRKKIMDILNALQFSVGTIDAVKISASVGVVIGHGTMKFDEMYGLVDQALYVAKREGKNRCHIIYTNQNLMTLKNVSKDIASAIHFKSILKYIDNGIVLLEFGKKPAILYLKSESKSDFNHATILGREDSDYVIDEMEFFSRISTLDGSEIEASMKSIEIKQISIDVDFRVFSSKGEILWFQAKAVPVPCEECDTQVFIILAKDINMIKKQEIAINSN